MGFNGALPKLMYGIVLRCAPTFKEVLLKPQNIFETIFSLNLDRVYDMSEVIPKVRYGRYRIDKTRKI